MQIGSWGTPEFGITEALSNLFGQGRTAQGGSNLFGPVSQTTLVPQSGGGFTQATQPISRPPTTNATTGGTGGSVLGSNTNTPSAPSGPSAEEQARQQFENQQRNQINSGWDSYTNQLNDMLNVGLPNQQAAQQSIAQTSMNQGVADLGAQKASSEQAVQTQQAANLKDLASNVKNLFQSGNIYLGSRGAGDSSAANQYSYAVGKMGTQARGDIQSQVSQRMQQIGDIYNQETGRLKNDYQTRIAGIADWFNQAQNQVRSQIGQAGLGRSQDLQGLSQNIYNQALSAMQSLQAEASNRRQALETWAMNNSKSVQELVSNMQGAQQVPQFTGINAGMPSVDSGGNFQLPAAGYGATSTQKKDIFGNPIA